MALIKCSNCDKEISDKATKCVHCGIEIKKETKNICKECGKEIEDTICNYCGYDNNVTKLNNIDINKSRNKEIIKLILSIVGRIIVGIVLFALYKKYIKTDFVYFDVCAIVIIVLFVLSIGHGESSKDWNEFIDDTMMYQNGTPAERALYNQLKRNNKNNKK